MFNLKNHMPVFVFILCASNVTNSTSATKMLEPAPPLATTVCAECHGERGISPNEHWPNLAGQKYTYLVNELRNYKAKRRSDKLMSPHAASLNDTQMQELSRYYSNQKLTDDRHYVPPVKTNPHQKQTRIAMELCVLCHGMDGISIAEEWPNLAAQKNAYLLKQLYDFRDRTRQGFMVDPVHMLKENEFQMVADYFSNLPFKNEAVDAPTETKQTNDGLNSIVEVGAGLFLHAWGAWISPFLVTSEGIIVTDPPTIDAASWLKKELKQRFDVPVRFVILSHADMDHTRGSGVFASDAVIIAHQNVRPIIEERLRTETQAAIKAKRVAVSPAEGLPSISFSHAMTLLLGGKTIELSWLNPYSHSYDDVISMYFVESDVLYEPDVVQVGTLGFVGFRFTEFTKSLRDVRLTEQKDFKYFLNGHSLATPKSVLTDYRRYLEALENSIQTALDQGQSLSEAKMNIKLSQFKHLVFANSPQEQKLFFETQLAFNIEGAYKQFKAIKEGREVKMKGIMINID